MKLNRLLTTIIVIAISFFLFSCCGPKNESQDEKKIKYVFLFIGDGMGNSHVNLTEAYNKSINDELGFEPLTMTQFPVHGQCYTHCKNRLITDSGAAGSAIACGEKANNSVISYWDDILEEESPLSIAEIAKFNNFKVGIISTVSIDHATPACFYAESESRKKYYKIGKQLPESDFDFFGGGGFKYPIGRDDDKENLYDIVAEYGYFRTSSLSDISKEDNKVFFVNETILSDAEMPYAIDQKYYQTNSLPEIVQSAISYLDNDRGFFMMVEAGKIDWAAHENDAATIIHEVKDFDNSIAVAYDFYLEHPDETLIIVTADHETGGVTLGVGINGYKSNLSVLKNQKSSVAYFSTLLKKYKKATDKKYKLDEVIDLANKEFFIEPIDFTDKELQEIELACKYYFKKKSKLSDEDLYIKYGDYNAVAEVFVKILNDRASIGFATWSHTAATVPVYSIGVGAEAFSGYIDNTEIKPLIMKQMGW